MTNLYFQPTFAFSYATSEKNVSNLKYFQNFCISREISNFYWLEAFLLCDLNNLLLFLNKSCQK